eukprot:4232693-Amphidinium_carterae.1
MAQRSLQQKPHPCLWAHVWGTSDAMTTAGHVLRTCPNLTELRFSRAPLWLYLWVSGRLRVVDLYLGPSRFTQDVQ